MFKIKPHILVVEDDSAIRELLAQLFTLNEYRVSTAEDGVSALDIYQKHGADIDLVITDLGLPNMDGLQLGIRLKAINSKIKMICVTGFVSLKKQHELFEAGFNEIINKPFDIRRVIERVQLILGQ